jgi:hypothetical protein
LSFSSNINGKKNYLKRPEVIIKKEITPIIKENNIVFIVNKIKNKKIKKKILKIFNQ